MLTLAVALASWPSAAAWAFPPAAALTSRHGGTIGSIGGGICGIGGIGGGGGGDGGGRSGTWPCRGGGTVRCATSMISLPRGGAFGIGRGRARAVVSSGGKTGSSSCKTVAAAAASASAIPAGGGDARTPGIWPCGDALDKKIGLLAIPAILNFMVIPLVGAVDTYWVGQMGDALALAGLSAANQVFSSAFWIISFLPSVVTPLIAKAAAAGDKEKLQDQVCEAMWLGTLVGLFGTVMLLAQPMTVLRSVLQPGAPALEHAVPCKFVPSHDHARAHAHAEAHAHAHLNLSRIIDLQYRTISFLPALLSTIGFATYRGKLDTVTPLKISVSAQLLNVILDPILIFKVGGTRCSVHPLPPIFNNHPGPLPRPLSHLKAKLGVAGAAAATAAAQIVESVIYMNLLLRQQVGCAPTVDPNRLPGRDPWPCRRFYL